MTSTDPRPGAPDVVDFDELDEDAVGKPCTLCGCTAKRTLFGFRVCDHHSLEGEDGAPCPACVPPRERVARELLDAFAELESERWVAAKTAFLDVVGYRVGDRAYAALASWLHAGEVVERIDETRVRFRFDTGPTAVLQVVELCPITAELLVAAGEVLDLEPIGASS